MSESGPSPAETIYREFASAADAGWTSGEILYRAAGKTAEISVAAFDAEGEESYPDVSGPALRRALKQLRSDMAAPGTGAWLSGAVRLTQDGRFRLDVDHDNEPAWATPTDAGHHLEEQELHPRDLEHQPEWFRQKLAEASTG